jgi:hypothetical protein
MGAPTSNAPMEVELSDVQKYATAALFTLVLHATASHGGQTMTLIGIQNSLWGISSKELEGGLPEGLIGSQPSCSSEPHQASAQSAPATKSYHFGDLTRKLGATITGDKNYQIGDLTRKALFGSQGSCARVSEGEQAKEPVKNKSYRMGDLTRKYINTDYECGDLTKKIIFGAEAVNKAKAEKKYLLQPLYDETSEKTEEDAFYCKERRSSQFMREKMLPNLYIRLGISTQEHHKLLSLPRPSTSVLSSVDRKEAAEDSWGTTLATLAQDSAIYAGLLDPRLSEAGLLLAAISNRHSLMQQDASSALALLEDLYAQSQTQMQADPSIHCPETSQISPYVWVAVQNLLHGLTSPPVQNKALLPTVPPFAACWYFCDARARIAFHYVAAMLQMPFSTVLVMENKRVEDLARQAGAMVSDMGAAETLA